MAQSIASVKRLQCLLITLVAWYIVVSSACEASGDHHESLKRTVIAASDFVYLGAFAVPKQAVNTADGDKWSTAYASGGLALRYVAGEKRFFATTHVYSGGLVYEMSFPGLVQSKRYPVAGIVRE